MNPYFNKTGTTREPLPADPVGARLCAIFSHLWHFITAVMPDSTEKPQWKTITRYPLRPRALWARWQDANQLIGVRFGHTTSYAMIDLDLGSPYLNAAAIAQIRYALETLGLCRIIIVQSSWSGGVHLYIPLPEPVPTFDLACALQYCLTAHGFVIQPGQMELFPNVKAWGNPFQKEFTQYQAHRLPLQPGSGSCLLRQDLTPLPGGTDLSQFLEQWDMAAAGQDPSLLSSALSQGRNCHRRRRRRRQRAAQVIEDWRTDLEHEIADGWSEHGQTNHLLKSIACYGVVFEGQSGDDLVEYIERIATSRPGYEQWCRHQHEIRARAKAWAKAADGYYWPLGSDPTRRNYAAQGTNSVINFNQEKANDAEERIQQAITVLKQEERYPATATARATAIAQEAQASLKTIYKHRRHWHPEADKEAPIPEKQPECKIDQPAKNPAAPASQSPEPEKTPEASHSGKFSTSAPNMKGEAQSGVENPSETKPFSDRGGTGGETESFPQETAEANPVQAPQTPPQSHPKTNPQPQPTPPPPNCVASPQSYVSAQGEVQDFTDVITQIQIQVQRLGWDKEEASQFVAERFNGKRRSRLDDEELIMLLYLLQDL